VANKVEKLHSSGASKQKLEAANLELGKAMETAGSMGRKESGLTFRRIMADNTITPRARVFKLLNKAGVKAEEYAKEAVGVDWKNPSEATAFYRKFVKPDKIEILNEFRYKNMLSGWSAHLKNHASNLLNTFFTAPITELVEGHPNRMVKYYAGLGQNMRDAAKKYIDIMKHGSSAIYKTESPNLIRTKKLPRWTDIPLDELEASDQFYKTLLQGGYKKAGYTAKQAETKAKYFLFRNLLDPKNKSGQGYLLSMIDKFSAGIANLRKPILMADGTKIPNPLGWFVPFVNTVTQVAKMGLEYNPVTGLATLPGSTHKGEQAAKMLMGAIPIFIAAQKAMEGKLTAFAPPKDSELKNIFYAQKKRPWSMQIGNKWIPFAYFQPFDQALAFVALVNYYHKDSPTADQDKIGTELSKAYLGLLRYYSDKTIMSNVGNFIKTSSGQENYTIPSNLGFTAGQFMPGSGFLANVAKIVDPIYRKMERPGKEKILGGAGESFMRRIPFLSKQLTPYTTPSGEPSRRSLINSFLPYDIGVNQPQYDQMFNERKEKLKSNANINSLRKKAENEMELNKISTLPTTAPTTEGIKLSDVGNREQLVEKYKQANKLYKVYRLSNDAKLQEEVKKNISNLGIDFNDGLYNYLAGEDKPIRRDIVDNAIKGKTGEELLSTLAEFRKEGIANGKTILSSTMIDDLYDEGIISYAQKKYLKSLKFDKKTGKFTTKKGSGKLSFSAPTKLTLPKSSTPEKITIGSTNVTRILPAKFKLEDLR